VHRSRIISITLVALAVCLAIPVAGCSSSRNVSTPRQALLGHWKNVIPGSATQVYFSDAKVTYAGQGSEYSIDYTVLQENQSKFTLIVRLGSATAKDTAPVEVTFSSNRKTMDLLPTRVPEKLEYAFVDSRQAP